MSLKNLFITIISFYYFENMALGTFGKEMVLKYPENIDKNSSGKEVKLLSSLKNKNGFSPKRVHFDENKNQTKVFSTDPEIFENLNFNRQSLKKLMNSIQTYGDEWATITQHDWLYEIEVKFFDDLDDYQSIGSLSLLNSYLSIRNNEIRRGITVQEDIYQKTIEKEGFQMASFIVKVPGLRGQFRTTISKYKSIY